MATQNYLEQIIRFNSDKDLIALREKYKEPTFFEIISKQRSETTYSSFLKWLFQSSSTDLNTVSLILLLLDVLVKRSGNKSELINEELTKDIVTRNFKIKNIEVETEKSVGVLADELRTSFKIDLTEGLEQKDFAEVIQKCKDRIDLFIKCKLEDNNNRDKELHIIIENKIDSGEGGAKNKQVTGVEQYNKADQTARYYMATKIKNKNLYQLYVYLCPSIEPQGCSSENYILVNYQDVVDGIIVPLLASTSLSARERFFLEELKTELTFPSLQDDNARSSIAKSEENKVLFTNLWNDRGYKNLVIAAALAAIDSPIWYISEESSGSVQYYEKQPIREVLEILKKIESAAEGEKKGEIEEYKKLSAQPKPRYSAVQKCAKKFGVVSDKYQISNDKEKKLLESFWENNKRFLLAFMNGISEEEYEKIKCLTQEVSRRDTTKYKVYYAGKCLNEEWLPGKKPSNNSETAWLIIRAWVEKDQKEVVDLTALCEKFTPKNCNPYYANGKYFQQLFYKYNKKGEYKFDGKDGKEELAEVGGWDFYSPKNDEDRKFRITCKDGEVIMLKMWRKDGLNKLIELVTDPNKKYFNNGEISVQPAR